MAERSVTSGTRNRVRPRLGQGYCACARPTDFNDKGNTAEGTSRLAQHDRDGMSYGTKTCWRTEDRGRGSRRYAPSGCRVATTSCYTAARGSCRGNPDRASLRRDIWRVSGRKTQATQGDMHLISFGPPLQHLGNAARLFSPHRVRVRHNGLDVKRRRPDTPRERYWAFYSGNSVHTPFVLFVADGEL